MTSEYSTLRASVESIDGLRRLTLDVSAQLGRRVTYSDVLAALVTVGRDRLSAVVKALPDDVA